MNEVKRAYAVDPAAKEILPADEGKGHFIIQATAQEAAFIKKIFEESYSAEIDTYVRSHIPYLDYSHDKENDRYDQSLIVLYSLIHKLGDEKTKRHIASMGILNKHRLNDEKDF
ncbi:hydrolase [Bacillus sp. B190/17]|uniref:Hydrolase n=1 Tax=Bacillus lumedeiriae TaxID=3058829 RepID=A0ABW8I8Y3_9BACI